MPKFSKSALSQFLRTDCRRQLKLHMSKGRADEIRAADMPPSQPARPGFSDVAEAGQEWEVKKLTELREHLGAALRGSGNIVQRDDGPRFEFGNRDLGDPDMLGSAQAGEFLVMPRFVISNESFPSVVSYARASGLDNLRLSFGLEVSDVIPDLIQVMPAGSSTDRVLPSGETERLPVNDDRRQLRVVDIKMTAEPGAGYFAEVTYYSMALAGWLDDFLDEEGRPFSEKFVVVPEAAIWPGSHEASALVKLIRAAEERGVTATVREKLAAWQSELEPTVFDVFRFRIDQIIRQVVPSVLATPWEDLPFHVTTSCKNCDYLGYPWRKSDGSQTWHPNHCWPTGERNGGHLSRIPGISRGAAEVLSKHGHGTVKDVAALPQTANAFHLHQSLRVGRTVIGARAVALDQGGAGVAPDSGTSSSMPHFVNLQLFITASFDVSSALTLSLGVSGSIYAKPFGQGTTLGPKRYKTEVRVSDLRDPEREFHTLRRFLVDIRAILNDVDIKEWENANRGPAKGNRQAPDQCRMQIYVWDQLTYDHICRVVGRHLPRLLQLDGIRNLAWLFPSEELLANPDHASKASPITIVENVVRSSVVVPLPHHYSLMGVARAYHPASAGDAEKVDRMLNVHPMFEDKLSDQIPSERAVEVWSRKKGWERTLADLLRTVERQHTALSLIVQRLQEDLPLAAAYMTAPLIGMDPPLIAHRMSLDGHLWLTFARLNQAAQEQEKEAIRAMPVYEREARGKSARLLNRLSGLDEAKALLTLKLTPKAGRRVYALAVTSTDISLREGEMGFALAPASMPGILDRSFPSVANRAGIAIDMSKGQSHWKMSHALAVTPVRIDREKLLIAVDESRMRPGILDEFELTSTLDLSVDVMLDPVATDHFTARLSDVLLKVGLPPEATNGNLVMRATGQPPVVPIRKASKSSPLSRFLWLAGVEALAPPQAVPPYVMQRMADSGIGLNPSQRTALLAGISSRLHLIWGPPGTGKSHTLAAMVAAAVMMAKHEGRGLRVLITASTWSAVDNLIPSIFSRVNQVLPGEVDVTRLTSKGATVSVPPDYPLQVIQELDRHSPSPAICDLRDMLTDVGGLKLVVVGSTPSQVVNLMRVGKDRYAEELFDLIVMDEGSQLDVAHAALAVASLATGGRIVCAGDPLQMAPIHSVEPPIGLEAMVGSVYRFMRDIHGVPETQLTLNYRSNAEIVDCFRQAGYGDALTAHAKRLRLRFSEELRPGAESWEPVASWTPDLDKVLDPDIPVSCIVHDDGMSAQSSDFEAHLIIALIWRLWTCMTPGLSGEIDFEGRPAAPRLPSQSDAEDFWSKRVGVVTPHRAQQSLVVAGLIKIFAPLGHEPDQIRKAVDTVERFQGQERDIMLASYAVGDPDTVADEEEFLHSLNRFNVMVSRARAKLIVVVSEQLVGHLSDDIKVVRQSRLLKYVVEAHCKVKEDMWVELLKPSGEADSKLVSFRHP